MTTRTHFTFRPAHTGGENASDVIDMTSSFFGLALLGFGAWY